MTDPEREGTREQVGFKGSMEEQAGGNRSFSSEMEKTFHPALSFSMPVKK